MDFINPALLAGTAAAAVPIILHLIMRQKPRRLEFPALRFLTVRKEANTRRLRLRHFLLLLLRIAAVCLVAIALARPSILATGIGIDQQAPVAAVFVFDTSVRMDYRQANQTRLDAARDVALWLLSQFPAESEVAVLTPSLRSAVFQVDLGAAEQRIDRLRTDHTGARLNEIVDEAYELIATSELQRREVYVFSDLTVASWSDRAGALRALATPSGVDQYVIDVGVENPTNVALGDVALSEQVLAESATLRLTTALDSLGIDGPRAVELYVVDDAGNRQKRDQVVVELTAGAPALCEFALAGLDTGPLQGQIAVLGEDGLAVDNQRWFSAEVVPPWRVLVAAPDPADDYAFLVTEALAPASFRAAGRARFTCDVRPLSAITNDPLTNYDALLILDPPPLADAVWTRVESFAAAGRGVGIFLGRNAAPPAQFNQPVAATRVLPGNLADQVRSVDDSVYFAPETSSHPILAKLRLRDGDVPWPDFPVYRHWAFDALADDAAVVARFANGEPALLERPVGRGRSVTMTTPVSDWSGRDPWNLLPVGIDAWPFVILMNETALYLTGQKDARFNFRSGEQIEVPIGAPLADGSYVLTDPSGESSRQRVAKSSLALSIAAAETVGNYRVRAGGEGGLDRGFSVNLAADESRLDRLDAAGLDEVLGKDRYRLARSRDEIDRDINLGRVGRELFPWLILAAALVLGIEQVLANRFYREA